MCEMFPCQFSYNLLTMEYFKDMYNFFDSIKGQVYPCIKFIFCFCALKFCKKNYAHLGKVVF